MAAITYPRIGYGCQNLSSQLVMAALKTNPEKVRTYPPAIGIPWGVGYYGIAVIRTS